MNRKVALDVWIQVRFRRVRMVPIPALQSQGSRHIRDLEQPQSEGVNVKFEATQEQWLTVLKNIGWGEFTVFEVPVRFHRQPPGMETAFSNLNKAHEQFRLGYWDATVIECRRACEAAARSVCPEGDARKAFAVLLQYLFPDSHDEKKREALDKMLLSLSQLRHEAAHGGGNPFMQIHRGDAELNLTVTTSIFRYIGEVLARREQDSSR